MATFYERLNQTAQRLIAQYGKSATLVRQTQTGPDHDPTIVEAEYAVTVVQTQYSLTNRSETLIQTGDRLGLIATGGEAEPQFDDKLSLGGTRYNLVDLQPLSPGETTLLWEFQARA